MDYRATCATFGSYLDIPLGIYHVGVLRRVTPSGDENQTKFGWYLQVGTHRFHRQNGDLRNRADYFHWQPIG
ncbi:hypothetical protein AVEN_36447-1 [Araneus ventricosus]|uniref:Uncharacterized protein n=1 Tax=Araneus ventricosus TaxID=182803 RepID=A0A4Y2S1Y8_ARAVE|nr:hypothetical protein AVEN_36447-1 [Araneus ventricosus]